MFFARTTVRTAPITLAAALARWAMLALALTLTGCAAFRGGSNSPVAADTIEYKTSGTRGSSLEVPPPLSSVRDEDRTPTKTASGLADAKVSAPVSHDVLPDGGDAQLRRSGSQRWRVVKVSRETAWDVASRFWTSNGYALAVEQPAQGLMETDWLQSRSIVPSDLLRRTIGNYADIFPTTQKRDKFRTRVEPGSEPGTVEIYVSHQGSEQVPNQSGVKGTASSEAASIVWTPVRANPEAEAEMLARLSLAFNSLPPPAEPGGQRTASPSEPSGAASSSSAPRARLTKDAAGNGTLVVDDLYDRAWRRIGLALDRGGFTVVDRDRSKGLYFVRYADPDLTKKKEESWLRKLAFWKADDKPKPEQYRIAITDGGQASTVSIQDPSGAPDHSENGQKILALLKDDLK